MAKRLQFPSERNTSKAAKSVLAAFDDEHGDLFGTPAVVFEHGHWWVTTESGAQFDAADVVGGGFAFEMVTEAHEDWDPETGDWYED